MVFGYGAPALFLVGLIAWAVLRPKGLGFVMTVSAAAIVLLFLVALLRFGKCIS